MTFPDGARTSVGPAGTGEEGMSGGLVPQADDPAGAESGGPHRLPCFGVDDTGTAVARTVELGGGALMPVTSVAGRTARLEDPYGARFAVLRSDPRET
ncbi:VOC family protein [Streptomyces pimonensis]|uniref:VOC family protein n=1 Tax=Streptomyces pimonensis TaxID=2860288 RepID=UPI003528E9A8